MTNKELLNFKFVDRDIERELANIFLKGHNNTKILLIRGHDLAGKNHFVDYIIDKNTRFTFITLDFKELYYTSAYKRFIEELECVSNGKFIQYVKDNYTDIVQITSKSVSTILKINGDSIAADIINHMLNTSMFFLNNHKEQESSINIITKYIKEIAKHENLIVVIKNFSYCDEYSIPIFFQTISSSIEECDIKYIITINEDDWQNNKKDVFSFFSYKVPVFPIEIKGFTDVNLFIEMLFDIFDFTTEDKNSIQHIFNVCNGYPGELKRVLSKVYFDNMNMYFSTTGKAKWDNNTIEKVIRSEQKKTEFKNPITKLIFLIVLFLDIEITYDLLVSSAVYISNKLHMLPVDEKLISESIQELIYSYQLLEIKYKSNEYIALNSSSKRELLCLEFEKDNIIPLLSRYISEFLLIQREEILATADKAKYYSQLAWHMYISKHTDWVKFNYNIAEEFYNNFEISLAQKIFVRLASVWDNFTNDAKCIIASCFYDAGDYENAEKIIEIMDRNLCGYQDLMLIVKIYNINMKKVHAVAVLDSMLQNSKFEEYINEILDTKQRILSNIASKRKEAKEIFDFLEKGFYNKQHNYKNFLITSMEYYRGEKVQNNFKILEREYLKTNNHLLLAELKVNQGFDLFWQGNIEDAKKHFEESISCFESLRIHEISYSLNNYANCQMMEGDFEGAILSLHRAQMFNESKYTDIVLKTHLMICYAITNNKMYFSLFEDLRSFLDNNKYNNLDISIYLKVSYALGFVQDYIGEEILFNDGKNYIEEALSLANTYDNETLPYIWFKDWQTDIENDIAKRIDMDKYFFFKSYRFEPWLLTITHD